MSRVPVGQFFNKGSDLGRRHLHPSPSSPKAIASKQIAGQDRHGFAGMDMQSRARPRLRESSSSAGRSSWMRLKQCTSSRAAAAGRASSARPPAASQERINQHWPRFVCRFRVFHIGQPPRGCPEGRTSRWMTRDTPCDHLGGAGDDIHSWVGRFGCRVKNGISDRSLEGMAPGSTVQ